MRGSHLENEYPVLSTLHEFMHFALFIRGHWRFAGGYELYGIFYQIACVVTVLCSDKKHHIQLKTKKGGVGGVHITL